jgi:hypothetical protein
MGEHEHHRRAGDGIDEGAEELFGAGVDPVEILVDEDDRARAGAAQSQGAQGIEGALAPGGGVHRRDRRVAGVDRQGVADERNVGFEAADAPHAVFNLGDDLGLAVAFLDAEALTHLVDDREEGNALTEGDAAAFEPRGLLARRGQSLAQLIDQARLADTRLTRDEGHLTVTGFDLAEEVFKRGQFALAANQRG